MKSIKDIVKRLFPKDLWFLIRKSIIVRKHRKVATYCDKLIKRQQTSPSFPKSTRKKDLCGRIIWQYWGQGYEQVPELVRICLDSVEKYKGDSTLIRLTDENLADYVELPLFVKEKREMFSPAYFSDLLRCLLLKEYGGVWLDSTVLLTGPLPQRYYDSEFFVFQRDVKEEDIVYWENAYAYYYGWYKGFKVNMLSSVFFARKGSTVVADLTDILLWFWENETKVPDYFFLQILFEQLVRESGERNCPIENDCVPHLLQQIINAGYKRFSVADVLGLTTIHKLSYKTPEAVERLKALCKEYNL